MTSNVVMCHLYVGAAVTVVATRMTKSLVQAVALRLKHSICRRVIFRYVIIRALGRLCRRQRVTHQVLDNPTRLPKLAFLLHHLFRYHLGPFTVWPVVILHVANGISVVPRGVPWVTRCVTEMFL